MFNYLHENETNNCFVAVNHLNLKTTTRDSRALLQYRTLKDLNRRNHDIEPNTFTITSASNRHSAFMTAVQVCINK